MVSLYSQLRPASLRGVDFDIETNSGVKGRKIVTHEFPGRDDPEHEDLGQAVSSFSIEAIIHGATFLKKAEEFEVAALKSGPAQLIHPSYGEMSVVVKQIRRVENTSEIGVIRFSLDCEKTGNHKNPAVINQSSQSLARDVDIAFRSMEQDFSSAFDVKNAPDFVASDATERLKSNVSHVKKAFALRPDLRGFDLESSLDQLNVLNEEFAFKFVDFYQSAADLTKPKPTPVIGEASQKEPVSATSVVETMLDIAKLGAGAQPIISGALNTAVRVKNASMLDLMQASASAIAAASATQQMIFKSRNEAVTVRSSILSVLNDVRSRLGTVGLDQSWRDIGVAAASLNKDIDERIGRLPRTVNLRSASVRSSLSLANRLYGDDVARMFSNAEEIAQRNSARHPGFVPAQELEVALDLS